MNILRLLAFIMMTSYSCALLANGGWIPMMFFYAGRINTLPIIPISLIIEALVLYWMLKKETISFPKALWMSCAGNFASMILGGMLVTLFAVTLYSTLLAVSSFIPPSLPEWTMLLPELLGFFIACISSIFIELHVLHNWFGYSKEILFYPVLIGNLISYGFTAIVIITCFAAEFLFPESLQPLFNQICTIVRWPARWLFRQ